MFVVSNKEYYMLTKNKPLVAVHFLIEFRLSLDYNVLKILIGN